MITLIQYRLWQVTYLFVVLSALICALTHAKKTNKRGGNPDTTNEVV